MDMGTVRGLITAALLALFVGLWFWSWSRKRQAEFDAASRLPLENDDRPPANNKDREQHS
jgi:cytochrome c oxidase cbb3-type subunit 4